MRQLVLALAAGAAALALAPTVSAGIAATTKVAEPASLMIYPLFDSRPATATIINVTNTNTDRTVCDGNDNLRVGDVRLHYVYYGAQQADLDAGIRTPWLEFDRFEDLSPADTLSVLASEHNPEGEVGFLTVKALTPDTDEAMDFDFLIGSAYIANSNLDILWSYLPYAFEANFEDGESTCGWATEADPGSEFGDDGDDYAPFPDVLYIDSFFQEKAGMFDNKLTLMSTSGQDFINEVDFLFFNNKEDRFSRNFKFVCWTSVPLSKISAVVKNLNGDPDEFKVETGWARIDGRQILDLSGNPVERLDSPALLGVIEQSVRIDFVAGHELHFSGTQNTELPN